MIELALYVLPSVAIMAYLTNVALRASRPVSVKVLCIVGLAGLLPITTAGFSDLMGRPKPTAIQHPAVSGNDVTVIASTMKEGVNIWLWVVSDDQEEPRAYALPWSEQAAKQLRAAESEGEREGTPVKMRQAELQEPQEETDEPMFYAAPQMPLPPKTAEAG